MARLISHVGCGPMPVIESCGLLRSSHGLHSCKHKNLPRIGSARPGVRHVACHLTFHVRRWTPKPRSRRAFLFQLGLHLAPAGQPKRNAMPKRVQLQRGKGWRMPPNTRKVDRSTAFGNPFDSVRYGVDDAVRIHREWLTGAMPDEQIEAHCPDLVAKHLIARRRRVLASLHELRGMTGLLVFASQPCHADLSSRSSVVR